MRGLYANIKRGLRWACPVPFALVPIFYTGFYCYLLGRAGWGGLAMTVTVTLLLGMATSRWVHKADGVKGPRVMLRDMHVTYPASLRGDDGLALEVNGPLEPSYICNCLFEASGDATHITMTPMTETVALGAERILRDND